MFSNISISKITLFNYRNHKKLSVGLDKKIVLFYGENGSGKTNILEAISLISSYSGFRNSKIESLINNDMRQKLYTVGARIDILENSDIVKVGIGFKEKFGKLYKITKINGLLKNQKILNDIKIFWLLPNMSNLYYISRQERRKFLDSMIYLVEPSHKKRIQSYIKLQQERIQILKNSSFTISTEKWLDLIEKKMAETAIVMCEIRMNFIKKINDFSVSNISSLPKILINLDCNIERELKKNPAIKVEDNFRFLLKENRKLDAKIGKTQVSGNKTDFKIINYDKNEHFENCSTGEQKIMLATIIFIFLEILKKTDTSKIIFLIDDIFSNMGPNFIKIILGELVKLNIQTLITDISDECIKKDSIFFKDTRFINIKDIKM